MRELLEKGQRVIMVPADFKFANKGVITDVNPQGFSLELEYKPDGILKSNYCEFHLFSQRQCDFVFVFYINIFRCFKFHTAC